MQRSHYAIRPLKSLPANFIESCAEDATREFLRDAKLRRSVAKDGIASVLKSMGYSLTDANGMVDRGRMFLFGKDHLAKLFGGAPPKGRLLLDVGAGDGNITSHVAGSFEKVIATEFSSPMVKRLSSRGYYATSQVDAIFNSSVIGQHCMDLVILLNVLDRADKPLTLLKQMKKLMTPKDGRLILAVVLPWCPFVEVGKEQRKPSEKLPMKGGLCVEGASFEESVSVFAERVLKPIGFEIVSWTKLPYLCEGDGDKEFYVLDDVVFVLKAQDDVPSEEIIQPGILNTEAEVPSAGGVMDWVFQKVW
jgi:SAM-dependent methyltransferase